jgi:hypothetical protein
MAETDLAKGDAREQEGKKEATPATVERTQQFRQELLKRLPRPNYSTWSVKDDFRIEEDWEALAGLNGDTILAPLEKLAPGGGEGR